MHVRQPQHERRVRQLDAVAVRGERVGDRADGVRVLLRGPCASGPARRRRPRRVPVRPAAQRPGEDAAGGDAVLEADEQLGGRAEQAVDAEGPAAGVALGQPLQRPAHVQRLRRAGLEVAGQDDLADLARRGCARRRRRRPRSSPSLLSAPSAKRTVPRGRAVRAARRRPAAAVPTVVSHHGPARWPTTTRGTTRTPRPRAGSKANEPKQTRPLPGQRDLVGHVAAGQRSRHHCWAVVEAGRGP